ncbi:hypothetical protein EsH8_IX_000924 [Colletotrichum jinshuiense]
MGQSSINTESIFNRLPSELQDVVFEFASNPEDPQIRFVSLEQAVRHNPDCIPATCQCRGDPYKCNLHDLIFVRIPTVSSPTVLYNTPGAIHPLVIWDPLLENIKTIAMGMENWEQLGEDMNIENVYNSMDSHHAWKLIAERGFRSVIDNPFPDNWPPAEAHEQDPWHPNFPQRALRDEFDQPGQQPGTADPVNLFVYWSQNMRVLSDVFTGLEEFYLVDFEQLLLHDFAMSRKIYRYLETPCDSDDVCEVCRYSHPGRPKVWGSGLDELEFIEVRICAAKDPGPNGLEIPTLVFQRQRWAIEHAWPEVDVNGKEWRRPAPKVKLMIPIFRRLL